MITIIPRHGMRYASKHEALADWYAGREFRMKDCITYCSKRDFSRNHFVIDGLTLDWNINQPTIALEFS